MSRSDKEVILQPLTWENIDDLVATDSGTEYFPLPTNEDEIIRHMGLVSNQRRHNIGHWFAAYDKTDQKRLVGGGQLFYPGRSPITEIGYWVTSGLKRSGYGSSILGELEKEAIDDFPCLERLELKINQHNIGSLALANAMGYELLYIHEDGDLVFWKVPA